MPTRALSSAPPVLVSPFLPTGTQPHTFSHHWLTLQSCVLNAPSLTVSSLNDLSWKKAALRWLKAIQMGDHVILGDLLTLLTEYVKSDQSLHS